MRSREKITFRMARVGEASGRPPGFASGTPGWIKAQSVSLSAVGYGGHGCRPLMRLDQTPLRSTFWTRPELDFGPYKPFPSGRGLGDRHFYGDMAINRPDG